MYKACIFDLDGTLTNTLDSLTYSTNKTLEEMGLEPITLFVIVELHTRGLYCYLLDSSTYQEVTG